MESVHHGAYVVVDSDGTVVLSGGDPERMIFPRSAIKALQALPLVASGAAAALGLGNAELALACASHSGLPVHTETAAAMLRKAGRDVGCLECGIHWPSSRSAARALAASGALPSALHNNCSGKHAGFICTAIATGVDPAGYVGPDHATMRTVTGAISAVMGVRLEAATRAVDGCSIPTFEVPLRAVATGFARFGTGLHMPEGFAAAAAELRGAVAAHPDMVAGPGRFDTVVTAAMGGAAFVKTGAEGVQAGVMPGLGLGFAIKCDDGASRAADACTAALLRRFLSDLPAAAIETLRGLANPVLTNWNGVEVGAVRGLVAGAA